MEKMAKNNVLSKYSKFRTCPQNIHISVQKIEGNELHNNKTNDRIKIQMHLTWHVGQWSYVLDVIYSHDFYYAQDGAAS